MLKKKGAAIELSIGTIVIVVIAMTMLILGLVLVRNIFGGATESVNTLNEKVKGEITNLFAEEDSKIAIRLGADKLARIKSGTTNFGIGIGAKTRDGSAVTSDGLNLKYYLEKTNTVSDCGGLTILDHQFNNRIAGPYEFESTEGERGYSILFFSVPSGTPECTQRIKIQTIDNTGGITSTSFRVQIISSGIFS